MTTPPVPWAPPQRTFIARLWGTAGLPILSILLGLLVGAVVILGS